MRTFKRDTTLLALKMEEDDQEPRNMSDLKMLERQKTHSPIEPSERNKALLTP